jgi:hypothetical protein
MRQRLEREEHPASSAAWSVAVPIVVRDASLSLGKLAEAPTIDSIECTASPRTCTESSRVSCPR